MSQSFDAPTLVTVNGTPIKVKPAVSINLLALWATATWLAGRKRPERSWPARLAVGVLSATALASADFGHAISHTVSARWAGAPMDEIRISMGMPRTIYFDNDVSPQTHRMRALGGPIFSFIGLLTSLLLRLFARRDTLVHEVAGWSCVGHGFIFSGALAPLPFVDAGSILKWTLVERGRSPAEADAVIRKVDLSAGTALTTAGVAFASRRRWLPAVGLTAAGVIAIGAGLDKIR